jgi:anti-sigma regulatory factor (Ser/Thr protein kinase)
VRTEIGDPSASREPVSLRIRGGLDAPHEARRCVRSALHAQLADRTASDAALIVSELVTNSVLHASVGPNQALTVELTTLEDRLRITVIDPGSRLEPRLAPPNADTPGGFGLVVVDELCTAWGVARDGIGTTRVWCDLLLEPAYLRPADD